jgi:DNA-directed RNA polymerase subunit RPC12/RpoP
MLGPVGESGEPLRKPEHECPSCGSKIVRRSRPSPFDKLRFLFCHVRPYRCRRCGSGRFPNSNPIVWSASPRVLDLGKNEVHVWRASLKCAPALIRRIESTLSDGFSWWLATQPGVECRGEGNPCRLWWHFLQSVIRLVSASSPRALRRLMW